MNIEQLLLVFTSPQLAKGELSPLLEGEGCPIGRGEDASLSDTFIYDLAGC